MIAKVQVAKIRHQIKMQRCCKESLTQYLIPGHAIACRCVHITCIRKSVMQSKADLLFSMSIAWNYAHSDNAKTKGGMSVIIYCHCLLLGSFARIEWHSKRSNFKDGKVFCTPIDAPKASSALQAVLVWHE